MKPNISHFEMYFFIFFKVSLGRRESHMKKEKKRKIKVCIYKAQLTPNYYLKASNYCKTSYAHGSAC